MDEWIAFMGIAGIIVLFGLGGYSAHSGHVRDDAYRLECLKRNGEYADGKCRLVCKP